jgi:hypothetical protein
MNTRVLTTTIGTTLTVMALASGTPVLTANASGTMRTRDSVVEAAPPIPSHFSDGRITNPWFPLKPGVRMVYSGVKDGKHARDVFFTTHRTRSIQGVTCRAVDDRLYLDGVLSEQTTDWYAQSRNGDVWYFGERTAELDRHGHVLSREGSWLAGRDGARAGIYINAHPRVGDSHRQEYYRGHADDHYRVLDTSARVTVPAVSSRHAVLTEEWTPLEPGVVDHKYYVRDVGVVAEQSASGPRETGHLVSVTFVR